MSVQEQEDLKHKYYGEAMRYMDNAKDCLQKAQKDGKVYHDTKYVRMACGTAYSGMLIALDGFLILKGVHTPKARIRKSIEYYQDNITKIDRKMSNYLNIAYKILHLSGYYDGIESVTVVKEGFDMADTIIKKIKPADFS